MTGPLTGYRIIEVAGIGPGPFCAMMLADMGADVVRVDRAQNVRAGVDTSKPPADVLARGRRNIAIDLKQPDGVEALLKLVESADAIIEGFRPGVMERLGIGPDVCMARNPKLVFGRMTGWGQEGPYAAWSGHDINYISLSGTLAHIGKAGEGECCGKADLVFHDWGFLSGAGAEFVVESVPPTLSRTAVGRSEAGSPLIPR